MKKLSLIITAISLLATAAEARTKTTNHGPTSTTIEAEKSPNGTITIDSERTTEAETPRHSNGSLVTVNRTVDHEYDSATKTVSSSKDTKLSSDVGSVSVTTSSEHQYNPTNKSITSTGSTSATLSSKTGYKTTKNSERDYTVTKKQ